MKNGGGHFAPELGGHFELESGGHFKLELGGQYHWNLHRKHFVESLLNKEIVMQGINKCFQTNDVELCINGYHKDNDYISTKEKLSKTIV